MSQSIPIIYSPRFGPARISLGGRFLGLVIGAGCLTMLLIGTWLTPSPKGMGTHTQLHLQPCQFLERTGIPCPSCGMTTSVTYFAHGHVLKSFYEQPMGTIIAILAAAGVWIGFYIAITGKPVHKLLRGMPAPPIVVGFMILWALAWGWKIFIHVKGLE